MNAQKPHPKQFKVKVGKKPDNPNMYHVGKLKGSKSAGETFTWEAPDDSAITISFPPVDDPLGIGSVTLQRKESFTKQLSFAKPTHGHGDETPYRYSVYCHETHTYAEGTSDPEIIIDK